MQRILAAVILFAGAVAAQPPPVGAEGSPAADTGYFQIVRPVAKGVWLLAEPRFQLQPIGNVTVIEQSDGLVLVDAGGSPGAGRRIVEMIRGISPKPVKAVIVTQWHGDKVQGLSEILKAWPQARTIATAATRAHLSNPATMNSPAAPDAERNAAFVEAQRGIAVQMRAGAAGAKTEEGRLGYERAARLFDQYALDMDGALTLAPQEGFETALEIPDRIAPVKAMFLGRADTDGDAVVWLPKQRIVIAGEIVILPFPYGYRSYPADWIATLGKLRAMPFKLLIPGHGMEQTDRVQLDRIAAALKDVRAQVAPLAAEGLSLDAVRAKVDLSAHAKVFCGSDPWLTAWFDAFFVDPIVESAYKEAKGEPIVQSLGG
jgi:glyoxylase-like metal-dependent hydrolase (beta-lactamase superfamily II)